MAASKVGSTTAKATAASPNAPTFTAATAGNLLIAVVVVNRSATTLPTVTTPSGWTLAKAVTIPAASSWSLYTGIFYKVAAGGETTVSFAYTSSASNAEVTVEEWSGLGAFDVAGTGQSSTAASGTLTDAITTAATNEWVFAALGFRSGASPSVTWSGGLTVDNGNTGTVPVVLQTATGTYGGTGAQAPAAVISGLTSTPLTAFVTAAWPQTGSFNATVTGVVATVAAAAPAGTLPNVTVTGVVSTVAAAAPAGSVATTRGAASSNFDGGTSGTTVTAANSGGTSGDAFDSVTIGSGSTLTFDNAHAHTGALSMKAVSAASTATYGEWTFGATFTEVWCRAYLYMTANPASLFWLSATKYATNSFANQLRVTTTGTIQVGTGTASTNTVALNQWVRIEWHVIAGTTTGQVEWRLFNSPDSTTATETFTSSATLNTQSGFIAQDFGQLAAASAPGAFWLDDVAFSTSGWVGPAAGFSTDATVTGAVATSAAAAPAGVAAGDATGVGALATVAAGAPAGSVSGAATITGAVATSAASAPAGTATGAATVTGVAATVAAAAPAGSLTTSSTVTGAVAASTSAAAAGVVTTTGSATAPGVAATVTSTAPAGTLTTTSTLTGVTATASTSAPAGSVAAAGTVTGATATAAAAAAAGSVAGSALVTGTAATTTAAAAAGVVNTAATITAPPAADTTAAPSGTVTTTSTITGATAASIAAAVAGTVSSTATLTGPTAASIANAIAGVVATSTAVNGLTAQSITAAIAGDAYWLIVVDTPPERTAKIAAEFRAVTVKADPRTVTVTAEPRTVEV